MQNKIYPENKHINMDLSFNILNPSSKTNSIQLPNTPLKTNSIQSSTPSSKTNSIQLPNIIKLNPLLINVGQYPKTNSLVRTSIFDAMRKSCD
jgi:hypothetical protein